MTLKTHVDRYVALKRHLGFKFLNNERMLRSWAAFAMTRGDDVIVADTMIGWARDASSPAFARKRLSVGRRFAVWLHAEDQRHEIPPNDVLGPTTPHRPAPHLLTNAEIRSLMAAALSLPPAGAITPHTWHCIIGLMATTGLRRCEVCALRLTDITPDGLVVRETKFNKSRLVALHRSTVDALGRYLTMRQRCGAASEHLFVLSTGRAINPDIVTGMFVKLARRVGLRGGPGEPGPRLHDLRHRFAVRSLEHAVATDRDSANRHMLALATDLGHNNVSSTYWYLEATPVLLCHIAREAERAHARRALP
ncbi:MAG: tyrosine-type recombinase/integrase [Thiotrichales bacterium]|nr:tyrosine-type recombinase/integrase [Thiotrichales bacterium]